MRLPWRKRIARKFDPQSFDIMQAVRTSSRSGFLGACLIAITVATAGCHRSPVDAENTAELAKVASTDDLGRPIKLKGVPHRVITIGPGITETVFALGAGANLVGRDSASDYPPGKFPQGIDGLAVAGDFRGPNAEQAVALRPDLIIVQGETFDASRADSWQQKIGAPVAVLNAPTVMKVAQDIERVGFWLNCKAQADKVVAPIMEQINIMRLQMAPTLRSIGVPTPSAFFAIPGSPIYTAGKGTLIDDVLSKTGFTNIAADLNGYKPVNMEQILARNPQCYITVDSKPDRAKTLRELQQQPALRNLPCVKAQRVLVLAADEVERPGPRLAKGLRTLSSYAVEMRRQMIKAKASKKAASQSQSGKQGKA
jgi:iron complex transport system substrate-binding protein